MHFTNDYLNSIADPGFRQAFRDYFAELGVTIRDWDSLFAELDSRQDVTLVRKDETGRVIGFLLLNTIVMSSGFFTTSMGFVEELYVAPAFRHQGHAAAMMALAEARSASEGCICMILTTDSAPDFYRRLGYVYQPQIVAKNGDPVFVKPL